MSFRTKLQRLSCVVALIVALTLNTQSANAALGDHIWSTGIQIGAFAKLDGTDHIVLHGAFFGTIDLGGGPLTAVNFLDGDEYLARFDANGNHIWSIQFTPVGNGASNERVAVDPAGNIYLTGKLFLNTTIDYGGGVITGNQMYVAKFDANGIHQWSSGYGDGWPTGIDASSSQVAVTGYTNVGVDFGGGVVGNAGGNDIFVGVMTSAGAHAWSAGFGDAGEQGGMDVAIDVSDNVLITGTMFGTVDFGGGGLVANALDIYLAKFSSAGAHQWSHVFDGLFSSGGGILANLAVAAGPSGEVAIAGQLSNSADFGGGNVTSVGFGDMFAARFDPSGNHAWSIAAGGTTSTDQAQDVDIDSNGNVMVTGAFSSDADFGGGTITFDGDIFEREVFVALYDSLGAHLFSNGFGPNAGTCRTEFDSGDQMFIHGSGSLGMDFGGGPLPTAGLFLVRLEGASGPPTAAGNTPWRRATLRSYPNPFNPVATVEYVLDVAGSVYVSVHNVRGQLVTQLVRNRWHEAGRHAVSFNAKASGVYFVRLSVGGETRTVKMVAIK